MSFFGKRGRRAKLRMQTVGFLAEIEHQEYQHPQDTWSEAYSADIFVGVQLRPDQRFEGFLGAARSNTWRFADSSRGLS